MKKTLALLTISLCGTTTALASDHLFAEGKTLFQENCLVCHNAQLDPPQAPPMFGVQMKYKMATPDKESFINKMTSFATHPTEEKALLKKPVQVLGVMPDMGFDEGDVRKITAYLYDETFAPPCKHWEIAMRMTQVSHDMKHYQKIKKRYNALCVEKPSQKSKVIQTTISPSFTPAEEGTLKSVMQHLGQDYAALNQAILVEDFEQAAQSAHKIAYHDEPSMWQKMKIIGSLRTEVSDFKKADKKVHQLALNIEKEAKAKNMNGLIQQQSNMLSACMSCHSTYRQRIIKILY
ncbi:MAG: cytochrome c [Mariprofundaceae bacterium]|nr:cytochrome c [Mariprofundaceae bacterium]